MNNNIKLLRLHKITLDIKYELKILTYYGTVPLWCCRFKRTIMLVKQD